MHDLCSVFTNSRLLCLRGTFTVNNRDKNSFAKWTHYLPTKNWLSTYGGAIEKVIFSTVARAIRFYSQPWIFSRWTDRRQYRDISTAIEILPRSTMSQGVPNGKTVHIPTWSKKHSNICLSEKLELWAKLYGSPVLSGSVFELWIAGGSIEWNYVSLIK